MAEVYVNLDALIPREDFEAAEGKPSGSNMGSTQAITELEKGRFFLKRPQKTGLSTRDSELDT